MLEAYSRAWTEIDYDAIAHNVEEVRKLVKKTKIMGIVKANAYGLGDVACAKALLKCGVDYFGVSSVDEALNLRNSGIQENILILGYTPSMHFHYHHEQNIVQSLISIEYARELNKDKESPLAGRMRPATLDEVVGQEHNIGKDKLLY